MSNYHYILKVVLLGGERSGKSSFLAALQKQRFKPTYSKTTANEFANVNIVTRLKTFRLQIWDTAGMEQCVQQGMSLLPSAAAVLVFYDATSPESYATAKGYLQRIEGNKCVALIATKTDVTTKKVSALEAKDFAHRHNVLFFETSAKNQTSVFDATREVVDVVFRLEELGVLSTSQDENGIKRGPLQLTM